MHEKNEEEKKQFMQTSNLIRYDAITLINHTFNTNFPKLV